MATPRSKSSRPWKDEFPGFNPQYSTFLTFHGCLLLLLQVYVGEGWDDIMDAYVKLGGEQRSFIILYFLSFQFLVGLILTSLATGIILETYVGASEARQRQASADEDEDSGNSFQDRLGVEEAMYRDELGEELDQSEIKELGKQVGDASALEHLARRHSIEYGGGPRRSDPTFYKITVRTADMRGAGTNANVVLTLHGSAGPALPFPLHRPDAAHNQALPRGSEETFFMPSQQDLGELEALEVEMDGSGVSPAWLLESVTVSRGENSHSFAGAPPAGWWFFPHGKWLGQSSMLSGPQPATARIKAEWHTGYELVEYHVIVTTADKQWAGTDANVFLSLTGELGRSPRLRLDNAEDNFERGKKDCFVVKSPPLGALKQAELHCDGSGAGPAWCCDTVEVRENEAEVATVFNFSAWFDGKAKETGWTQCRAPGSASPAPVEPQTSE
eukprot:Transcript_13912.p2 GENE.Transcript_13912~~Transcript_13912.p2  ORF type:complete len:444 (+),score=194.70 Transcript_13912:1276-2607(+)